MTVIPRWWMLWSYYSMRMKKSSLVLV
jgi:hypothetical protein